MITVLSCNYSETAICREIFAIRSEVFVEEQEVDRKEEFDAYEESSMHYLGSLNGKPAGTARWRITNKGIKLERFAVLKPLRNNGIAAAVLENVLRDVVPLGQRVYLHAQVSAVGFYEKYGFKKEGPMFSEANIDHFVMYFDRG
jgi:predicted GNAT family N-acyltransferase